jgi:hypothetical protein
MDATAGDGDPFWELHAQHLHSWTQHTAALLPCCAGDILQGLARIPLL